MYQLPPPYQRITGHPLGRLDSIIRQDQIRSRPTEAHECLEHRVLLVEPAPLGGCLEHGVLSRYVVDSNGQGGAVAQEADHIQIGHAWLDHHDISALYLVSAALTKGLAVIGRIHLSWSRHQGAGDKGEARNENKGRRDYKGDDD